MHKYLIKTKMMNFIVSHWLECIRLLAKDAMMMIHVIDNTKMKQDILSKDVIALIWN